MRAPDAPATSSETPWLSSQSPASCAPVRVVVALDMIMKVAQKDFFTSQIRTAIGLVSYKEGW